MFRSYFIAFIILAAAFLWMMPAVFDSGADDEALTVQQDSQDSITEDSKIMKVEVLKIKPELMHGEIVVNGQTKASRVVDIRARTEGRFSDVLLKRGDELSKGQLIAKMDIDSRQSRLDRSKAVLRQRKTEYEVAKGLQEKGFNSQVRLETARANEQIAKDEVFKAKQDISYTKIHTPFAGALEMMHIEQGDYVRIGDVIATVADLDPMDISVFVSERYINSINIGMGAEIELHENTIVNGKVHYIAKLANESTRTFRVDLTIDNSDHKISGGLTAKVKFLLPENNAHHIPLSSMVLDDKGVIGVKVIENDKAKFMPVKILKEDAKSVWVDGLTGEIDLVIVGQQFVKDGETVTAVYENKI